MSVQRRGKGRLREDVAGVLALVLGTVALMTVVGHHPGSRLLPIDAVPVVAVISAAVSISAAPLGLVATWLAGDRKVGLLGVAVGADSLLAAHASMNDAPTAAGSFAEVPDAVVHALVLGLLAAVAAQPRTRRGRVLMVVGAVALVLVVPGLAVVLPGPANTSLPPLRLGLALAWVGLTVAVAVRAARQGASGLVLAGAGVAVLGAAHLEPSTTAIAFTEVGPTLSGVRLVALVMVVCGAFLVVRQELSRLDSARVVQEERLRLAEIRLARTVERDHELRSGLAGLAGAATVLAGDTSSAGPLGSAVASELNRLDDLLHTPVRLPGEPPMTPYAVGPVLAGLATLRGPTDMDLRVDVDPGLQAVGASATLAQVVTSLLANAVRHAPGSPVRITAMRWHDRVVVRVRDFGPGLAPGSENAVLVPGVRDERHGGLGLGLGVCSQVLLAEHASIAVRPADPRAPGCVVVVQLPAAAGPVPDARPTSPPVRAATPYVTS